MSSDPPDESFLIAERRRKLDELRREGNPFPNDFRRDALAGELHAKYGGLEASDLKRMRELEDENNRLKKMYADLALENRAIKDLLGKL